jgi:hypothetical protein
VGIAPRLSEAELVTLAMMQAMLGFTSEARWLRHASAHLRHLFPYLPEQSGYNKRLRKAADSIRRLTRTLARDTTLWTDDVPQLIEERPGQTVIGDKNYFGRDFEQQLTHLGIRLLRPTRKSEAERHGSHLFKPPRQVIDSVNETFKGQLDLERHRGRTPGGVAVRVLQRILALTAAIWHNDHTGQTARRALTAYDH